MSNKTHIIIELIAALVILVLSILLFRSCNKPQPEPSIITKHDTTYIRHTDTIRVEKEKVRYIEKKVIDTLYLADTTLLREQKTYQDSLSTVWVSGIDVELDSMQHYIPRDTILINTETTTTIVHKKKFSWGLHLGLGGGYGLMIQQQPQFSPYIGIHGSIGINYNF